MIYLKYFRAENKDSKHNISYVLYFWYQVIALLFRDGTRVVIPIITAYSDMSYFITSDDSCHNISRNYMRQIYNKISITFIVIQI